MQVVAMFKRKLEGSTAQTSDVGVGEEYKENASMMNIDGQGLQGAKEEMERPHHWKSKTNLPKPRPQLQRVEDQEDRGKMQVSLRPSRHLMQQAPSNQRPL
jgi:hypothetical protein